MRNRYGRNANLEAGALPDRDPQLHFRLGSLDALPWNPKHRLLLVESFVKHDLRLDCKSTPTILRAK